MAFVVPCFAMSQSRPSALLESGLVELQHGGVLGDGADAPLVETLGTDASISKRRVSRDPAADAKWAKISSFTPLKSTP